MAFPNTTHTLVGQSCWHCRKCVFIATRSMVLKVMTCYICIALVILSDVKFHSGTIQPKQPKELMSSAYENRYWQWFHARYRVVKRQILEAAQHFALAHGRFPVPLKEPTQPGLSLGYQILLALGSLERGSKFIFTHGQELLLNIETLEYVCYIQNCFKK